MKNILFGIDTGAAAALYIMPAPEPAALQERIQLCRSIGIQRIVSLLGLKEMSELGLGAEAAVCAEHDVSFAHFPIEDFGVPPIDALLPLVKGIAEGLRQGIPVVLHCRAGIGRSGLVASCILQCLGHEPATAVAIVSAARGQPVPETAEQADFVRRFGLRLRGSIG